MMTYDQIETRLADLHLQRGHLASHGKDTSKVTAEIVRLHEEQATLADVEAAQIEQAREASATKHQADITAARTEIADLAAASTKALQEAETNLRAAVAAQRLHHQHEAAKRKLIGRLNQLTGAKESALSEFELCRQESRLWLAQLNTLTNAPGQYGDLRFPSLHLPNPSKSWT